MSTAKLILDDKPYELPVVTGTEGERAVDIRKLRATTGYIALDPGYGNTGSCLSAITFIDGERGILRYRGYPIEELAQSARFPEVCYLIIYDHLPNQAELNEWRRQLTLNSFVHEGMVRLMDTFPPTAHPMNVLAAMIMAMPAFDPESDNIKTDIIRIIAKAKTIAAFAYRKSRGEPVVYPRADLSYMANFLRMMFATPAEEYEVPEVCENALNLLLIMHVDHEQNCSTSTVRMVGSSRASLYASIAAGVCALSGPLHGGANQEVLEMLERIQQDGGNFKKYVDMAKDKKSGFLLMGFGHRVYKNRDPRAEILKKAADGLFDKMGIHDPLLDLAKSLEEVALKDDYFIERKLYPNVDFYSGILYRALGIPTNMFTVMFALGRIPGWIAQWKEMRDELEGRIHRPRQIYTGETQRRFVPLWQRK